MSSLPSSPLPGSRWLTPAEVWPAGPQAYLDDLRAAGFAVAERVEVPSAISEISGAPARPAADAWAALRVARASDFATPGPNDFCYVSAKSRAVATGWGAIFLDDKSKRDPFADLDSSSQGPLVLRVSHADAAMDFLLRRLAPTEWVGAADASGQDETSIANLASPAARFPHARIEPHVVVGPDCELGPGVVLETGVRLGAHVRIGARSRIGAHTRIADDCQIGEDCNFTGSVSVGGAGFGLIQYPGEKVRRQRVHLGRVIIGHRVRIGAFVGIDRGVFADTTVGDDSAIDNLVQVGHNCTVGNNNVLCAFVGLSGSTELGQNVTLAGMVCSQGHLRIGDDAVVTGLSGVTRDVGRGETVKGYPARPLKEALEIQALTAKLPQMYRRLRALEKESSET